MHQTRIRRAYYRIFRVANTPDLGKSAGGPTAINSRSTGQPTTVLMIRAHIMPIAFCPDCISPLRACKKGGRSSVITYADGSTRVLAKGR